MDATLLSSGSDHALVHRRGLMSMLDQTALLSAMSIPKTINDYHGQEPPPGDGWGVGIPCSFAAMLASREDIDNAMNDHRPPDKRPDPPHCYASDLKVPRFYKEAVRSKYSHLWMDQKAGEATGLVDGGTFQEV